MPEDRVCLGVVVGAHGVHGRLRVKPFTADPEAIGDYGPVEDEARQWTRRIRVTGRVKGVVVAEMEGVRRREEAEALRGTKLMVPRAALPEPEDENEFYYADLVGLTAETAGGERLGMVRAVHDFGAGDVLEVTLAEGGTALYPFTRQVVPEVDLAGGRLVIEPPAEAGEES